MQRLTVFRRHMPDKHGKYITFCANAAHMEDMIRHVPEWFSSIDRKARTCRTYSPDPVTRQDEYGIKGPVLFIRRYRVTAAEDLYTLVWDAAQPRPCHINKRLFGGGLPCCGAAHPVSSGRSERR